MRKLSLLLGLVCLTLPSCSSNPNDSIIGTWQTTGAEKGTIEFMSDGKLRSPYGWTGTYKFLDDGRLAITRSLSNEKGQATRTNTFKVTITKDKLVLQEGTKSQEYKRVQ